MCAFLQKNNAGICIMMQRTDSGTHAHTSIISLKNTIVFNIIIIFFPFRRCATSFLFPSYFCYQKEMRHQRFYAYTSLAHRNNQIFGLFIYFLLRFCRTILFSMPVKLESESEKLNLIIPFFLNDKNR